MFERYRSMLSGCKLLSASDCTVDAQTLLLTSPGKSLPALARLAQYYRQPNRQPKSTVTAQLEYASPFQYPPLKICEITLIFDLHFAANGLNLLGG